MKIGRYDIVRELGRGGIGQVLLGCDALLQRQVAIKVLQASSQSPEEQRRFLREAQTVSRLSHRGIVTVYELGQDGGQLYIAMEFVDGSSLKSLIANVVPSGEDLRARLLLFRQVLEAMAYAHEQQIVHRDLKPDNIVVTKNGQAKILDFGLAFFAGNHSLTVTGETGMGTPAYVAPEQITDFAHTDQHADIYSLGVILFELLTGKCPLEAPNTVSLIYKVISEVPPPPSSINPAVSSRLDEVVARLLRKDPAQRLSSVRELLPLYDEACGFSSADIASYEASFQTIAKASECSGEHATVGTMPAPIVWQATERCARCGSENRSGYKFCNKCGAPVAEPCPFCGNTSNRREAVFCNNCGRRLDGTAQVGTPGKELLRGLDKPLWTGEEPQPTYLSFHRDYVKFGSYPQEDASFDSPIEWMILDKQPDRVLLIARYGLDCGRYDSGYSDYSEDDDEGEGRYRRGANSTRSNCFSWEEKMEPRRRVSRHTARTGVDWNSCTLNRWLNRDFYRRAFNEQERSGILSVNLHDDDGWQRQHRGVSACIFLLSMSEASKYFRDDEERCCQPTAYARAEGAYYRTTNDLCNGNGWWWLRSAGSTDGCAACVHDGGVINDRGRSVGDGELCIRPALYLEV